MKKIPSNLGLCSFVKWYNGYDRERADRETRKRISRRFSLSPLCPLFSFPCRGRVSPRPVP